MRKSTRSAFTLVELLVVMVIIAMLIGMIMPAINRFRESANRTSCENNQRNLARALSAYANAHRGEFPGYQTVAVGRQGPQRQPMNVLVSWAVAALEYAQQHDHYQVILAGGAPPNRIELLVCPSDPAKDYPQPLSYVANCGRPDVRPKPNFPADWRENGMFHRHSPRGQSVVFRESDFTSKPANRTLMLSENLQATTWYTSSGAEEVDEAGVGMVWQPSKNPSFPEPASRHINRDRFVSLPKGPTGAPKGDYNYARPSSNHPDGVVVTFADGTQMFLRDDVDYAQVYCRLMITDYRNVRDPGTNNPVPVDYSGRLDDSKLQR
jgi:prepilin-type N-terminal cleavage/methylation domain-containing protein